MVRWEGRKVLSPGRMVIQENKGACVTVNTQLVDPEVKRGVVEGQKRGDSRSQVLSGGICELFEFTLTLGTPVQWYFHVG